MKTKDISDHKKSNLNLPKQILSATEQFVLETYLVLPVSPYGIKWIQPNGPESIYSLKTQKIKKLRNLKLKCERVSRKQIIGKEKCILRIAGIK